MYKASISDSNFTVPENVKSPIEYFFFFFSSKVTDMIIENSNLYSVQKCRKPLNMTKTDLYDFIAIKCMMGIVKMPAYTDYWSKQFSFDKIADVMTLKRYQQLRRNLHFVNNEKQNDDRYFKIRPFLDEIRQNCLRVEHENRFSVDEMMVPYKGKRAGNRKQYVQKKPKKWGFKVFIRAGVTGFIYDFLLYGGQDTFRNISFSEKEEKFGLGAKVVIALCKSIPNPQCKVIYFDNFFSSIELVHYLRENYGIFSLGTIRENRLRNC